jgi:lysophospholipase L1-like esterase
MTAARAALRLAGTALLGWAAARVLYLTRCVRVGRRLAKGSVPFARSGSRQLTGVVLVIGDSTGVGTGAGNRHLSVAGQLAAAWPDVEIRNRCRNGARMADTLAQLEAEPADDHYAAVFIHVGGNDALRGTPPWQVRQQLHALLARARRLSEYVVLTGTANFGLSPAFFPPLSWLLTARARALRNLYRDVAGTYGVLHVDFFRERGDDRYARDPRRYYAADRLHPSSDAYREAWETIRARLAARGVALSARR